MAPLGMDKYAKGNDAPTRKQSVVDALGLARDRGPDAMGHYYQPPTAASLANSEGSRAPGGKENQLDLSELNRNGVAQSVAGSGPYSARSRTGSPSYMAPTMSSQTKRRILNREVQEFKPKKIPSSRPRRPRKPANSEDCTVSSTDEHTVGEKTTTEPSLESVDEIQAGDKINGKVESGEQTGEVENRLQAEQDEGRQLISNKIRNQKSPFKGLMCCIAPAVTD